MYVILGSMYVGYVHVAKYPVHVIKYEYITYISLRITYMLPRIIYMFGTTRTVLLVR